MARIMLGNLDGALALRQAREVLEYLADEWPDVQVRPKTFSGGSDDHSLLAALAASSIGLAILAAERLPATLPDGVVLAAVPRRLEARSALVARSASGLDDLAAGAGVGVFTERDGALLRALLPTVTTSVLDARLDEGLRRVKSGDLDGLIVPASTLKTLGYNERATPLEVNTFTPAAGQGAVAVLVRDEDLASELAYSLQHRPSFDRVRAEHAVAAALDGHPTGAFATVTDDGEMTLIASVVSAGGDVVQATVVGEAGEAEELGRELAHDMLDQLGKM